MIKKLIIFKSVDQLAAFFTDDLAAKINETPDGRFFSWALSGGSTPKVLFQYLAQNFRKKISWEKVLVFWSDERCVAPDDQQSNYRMTKESLLNYVPIPAANIFRIKGEADPSEESERYSEAVMQIVPSFNNIPRFDFMMLGLGEDGHTASIFPGNLHLFDSKHLFEVAEHPQTKQKRITATGNLINHSATVAFLVTGEAKSEIAYHVLGHQLGSEKLPAAQIFPNNGELLWLMDEKAAGKILDLRSLNIYPEQNILEQTYLKTQ
jgi:6-phosphogluconolactonase